MPANDRQVGGEHYKKHGGLQHWDVVQHFDLDYFQGQITKYVMRWKDKGGVNDLRKAAHFLEKYIEIYRSKENDREDKLLGLQHGGIPSKSQTEAPQADSAKRSTVPPTAGIGAAPPIVNLKATVDITCPHCTGKILVNIP